MLSPAAESSATREQFLGSGSRQKAPEVLIDRRLSQVARKVKWADVVAELCSLGALLTGGVLLGATLDQWIVPGGLSPVARLISFLILTGTAAAYLAWRVLPTLVAKVSPALPQL